MDFFLLDTMPTADPSYCILVGSPEGTEEISHRLSRGEAYGPAYPESPRWPMSKEFRGIKAGALVANTSGYVIVHREVKDVFVATGVPMEVLPFVLVDHKKKVASRDHFIVNVLGTVDCLNIDKSDIKWSKEVPGAVIRVRKYVLDPKKLKDAPDFFRVKEYPRAVVLSAKLGAALKPKNPTNMYLTKLEQAAGRK